MLIFATAKRKQDLKLLETLSTAEPSLDTSNVASHQDLVDLANGLSQEFNQVGAELGTVKNTQEQMIEIIGQLQQALVSYNQSRSNAGGNQNVESHKRNL
jgi:hypothetical protein